MGNTTKVGGISGFIKRFLGIRDGTIRADFNNAIGKINIAARNLGWRVDAINERLEIVESYSSMLEVVYDVHAKINFPGGLVVAYDLAELPFRARDWRVRYSSHIETDGERIGYDFAGTLEFIEGKFTRLGFTPVFRNPGVGGSVIWAKETPAPKPLLVSDLRRIRLAGETLRSFRLKKNLSQAELGRAVGVSGSLVGWYERKGRPMGLPLANKIATALEIGVNELYFRR